MAVHLTDETAPLFWPCASTRYWNYTYKWSLVCTFRLIWKRPQISFYRYIKCFLTLSGKISVILEWILGQSSYQQQSRKKRTNLFFSLPPPPHHPQQTQIPDYAELIVKFLDALIDTYLPGIDEETSEESLLTPTSPYPPAVQSQLSITANLNLSNSMTSLATSQHSPGQ